MGGHEVVLVDIAGLVGIAMSIIGFVTVWVKIGHDKGRQDEVIKKLEVKSDKIEMSVAKIESKTHELELRIAEFMGEIRVKFDYIKETVCELKSKGGSHAAKK